MKITIKYLLPAILLSGLAACRSKPPKAAERSKSLIDSNSGQTTHRPSSGTIANQSANLNFIEYLDDGDYFQLLAEKNKDTFVFINDIDSGRALLRGDHIQVKYKDSTLTVAGDNDSPMPASILVSIKKTGDGPVSLFRKGYGKKLKYTWPADKEYSSSYLDKIYLITEYYLSKTKNPLLQMAIRNRQELTYSIEPHERNHQHYTMIGIAPVGPNGSLVVQWLYIAEDTNRLYEYDLPEDKLLPFN